MRSIYGIHAVAAKLRHHPDSLRTVFFVGESDSRAGKSINPRLRLLMDEVHRKKVALVMLSRAEMERRVGREARHQGVMAQVEESTTEVSLDDLLNRYSHHSHSANGNEPICLLALDQVHDPHNLGACMRSADAFGAQAVIIPKDKSAGMSEVVARAACGAAETIPLIVVPNLARALTLIADVGIEVVGLAADAPQTLWAEKPARHITWVLGGEANGLRRLTREKCHRMVSIPMTGTVESLNVSVSAALCLAETHRWGIVSPSL